MAIIVECDNCAQQVRYSGQSGGLPRDAARYISDIPSRIVAMNTYLCSGCKKAEAEAMEAASKIALAQRRNKE